MAEFSLGLFVEHAVGKFDPVAVQLAVEDQVEKALREAFGHAGRGGVRENRNGDSLRRQEGDLGPHAERKSARMLPEDPAAPLHADVPAQPVGNEAALLGAETQEHLREVRFRQGLPGDQLASADAAVVQLQPQPPRQIVERRAHAAGRSLSVRLARVLRRPFAVDAHVQPGAVRARA